MTLAEQKAFWNKWNRFQRKQEAKYVPKLVTALQIQAKSFNKTQDVNAIPSFPIYEVLVNLYKSVGVEWAKATRQSVRKADGLMGFNETILRLMNEYFGIDLLNYSEWITQYSREVISQLLIRGNEQQMSPLEIADMIATHPEFNRMRAMRIARTETVTAANAAAQIYASTSGMEMNKTWIAVKDKRTRHDHRAVDGTTIDINLPFNVGGVEMMQPGARTQPNGLPVPAQEIVNCRCTVAYVAKRDENGRIILRQ
jgi:hypothetical protein